MIHFHDIDIEYYTMAKEWRIDTRQRVEIDTVDSYRALASSNLVSVLSENTI